MTQVLTYNGITGKYEHPKISKFTKPKAAWTSQIYMKQIYMFHLM